MLENYMGEIYALATAVVWAMAVIFFKKTGETVHPVALNLFKGTFASILIPITQLILGHEILPDFPVKEYVIMLLGGVFGLAIADTFFFSSLNKLGAARIAIVDCLYSPSIVIFAVILLGERLNVFQILGVVLVVSAVLLGNKVKDGKDDITRKDAALGLIYGAIAMLVMSVSIVGVKPVLDTRPLLWSMEMRLVGGNIMLWFMLPFFKKRKEMLKSLINPHSLKFMVPAAFLGTYVALILWLAGMKYATASIASALNQTNNIFIFIFAAFFLKEKITRERAIGIVLGICGVLLVTLVR